jgi:hypothetical protein
MHTHAMPFLLEVKLSTENVDVQKRDKVCVCVFVYAFHPQYQEQLLSKGGFAFSLELTLCIEII